jgi:pyridinium-3,5-biscarboxylic acid mononucleotide synthase
VLHLGFARLDLCREERQGIAEVVYAPGKTREQINAIVRGLLSHNTGPVLLTRVDAETADAIRADIDAGDYDREARLMSWRPAPAGGSRRHGRVSGNRRLARSC